MFLQRIEETETHLKHFIAQHFGVELQQLTVETPPRIEFGDLAFPFPFELAKTLRKPPRQIASEVEEHIQPAPHVERFVAAGGGYLNVFFKRVPFFKDLYQWLQSSWAEPSGEKVIVEHTNINPNKAAHIGHLRNAVLGDTFVRVLRASGTLVEVQNYIDNTGVQVADVVVGFRHLRKMSLEEIRSIEEPFDYYCWDLYAEVSRWYAQDESHCQYREQTLKEIEDGLEPTRQIAEHISMRIVLAHLKTMQRVGVRYQILPRESEILVLKFWEEAFQNLKETKAITYREEGPYQGCWTMQLPGVDDQPGEEKIIVRSNGTVTYVGKDIAYQLWKFGLLGKTFHYRPLGQYQDGEIIPYSNGALDKNTVWLTTSEPSSHIQPEFGHAQRVFNVIDVRQSYLQEVVTEGLRRLGFTEQADRSVHFAYEMVALSPTCCSELGIDLSQEERSKPYVEVSGRKGLGVKADDLIDVLIEKSLQEVNSRQKDLPLERRKEIAHEIAIGALRYFLLKYTRNSVIAFDFAEALSFEGETGPYLQYSVVRATNIFRKLDADDSHWSTSVWEKKSEKMWEEPNSIADLIGDDEIWILLLQTARLEEAMKQAVRTLEISYLAKHAFNLAQQLNLFYHMYHILSEGDPIKKCFYLTVADAARRGLLKSLDLLGIQVPERM
ncbi:arginine--tRNA ligase [Acidobacteria bacterium AH-259-D05]|nr:arginine--tRNA ligase [Acidobacteria bacterium AH-259-D05]